MVLSLKWANFNVVFNIELDFVGNNLLGFMHHLNFKLHLIVI